MDRWALITGAAGGIGLEFAKLLSFDKYNLVLVDVDEEKLNERKDQLIAEYGNKIVVFGIDLSQQDAGLFLFQEVSKLHIELDVLINNAGFGMFGLFSQTQWNRENQMIHLHVITPTQLTKLFLPGMIERDRGNILNVSSMAAFQPGPLMSIYYSTKAYLLSFTLSVAVELKDSNVSVTALCPGVTKTGFQKSVGDENPKVKWKMACPKKVAAFGYQAMKKGKILAIPGTMNKMLIFMQRFLSVHFVARRIHSIQERNRGKMTL
ncbi:MAG TPA: SDR family oxidoreductase [Sunxiuqinia sp.]|nr:SDR family oxidoreductase [Sunxiuqinia sp.]